MTHGPTHSGCQSESLILSSSITLATIKSVDSHGRDGWNNVDAGCQLPSDHPPEEERGRGAGGRERVSQREGGGTECT